MYLSACIEWLFQAEHEDIAERVAAAKDAGLSGVEFHLWRNKPEYCMVDMLLEGDEYGIWKVELTDGQPKYLSRDD